MGFIAEPVGTKVYHEWVPVGADEECETSCNAKTMEPISPVSFGHWVCRVDAGSEGYRGGFNLHNCQTVYNRKKLEATLPFECLCQGEITSADLNYSQVTSSELVWKESSSVGENCTDTCANSGMQAMIAGTDANSGLPFYICATLMNYKPRANVLARPGFQQPGYSANDCAIGWGPGEHSENKQCLCAIEGGVNECASNPCLNGGTCNDLNGSFSCSCPAGYSGDTCKIEPDGIKVYYEWVPVGADKECETSCNAKSMEPIFPMSARHHSVCRVDAGSEGYRGGFNLHNCRTVYKGDRLEATPPFECLCHREITSADLNSGSELAWKESSSVGENCTDTCAKSEMEAMITGTHANSGLAFYICATLKSYKPEASVLARPGFQQPGYSDNDCAIGWGAGEHSENKQCLCGIHGGVNECASNPCLNGGTCNDLNGSFSCSCPAGYSGDTCEIEPDGIKVYYEWVPVGADKECETSCNAKSMEPIFPMSARHHSVCRVDAGSEGYRGGFNLHNCRTVYKGDRLEARPPFECLCHREITSADLNSGSELAWKESSSVGENCTDTCAKSEMEAMITGTDANSGLPFYICATLKSYKPEANVLARPGFQQPGYSDNDCAIGWGAGEHSENKQCLCVIQGGVNECASNPCLNGGTCNDLDGSFSCSCPTAYSGGICEIDSAAGSNTTASSTTGSTSGGKRTVSTTIESIATGTILNSTATSIPSTATVSNTIASSTTVGITTAKITDVSTTTEDIASSTTVSTTAGTIASSAAESNTTASNIVGTTTSRITSVSSTTERTASSTSQSTSTRSVPNSASPNSTIVINTTASSATLGITTAKITGVSTTTEDIPSSTTVSTATGTIASSAAGSNTTARSAVATATTSRIRGVSSTTESTVNSKAVSSTTGSVASAGGRSWTTVSYMSTASRKTVETTAARITNARTKTGTIAESAAGSNTTASSTAGSTSGRKRTVSTTAGSIATGTTLNSTATSIPSTVNGSATTVRNTVASSTTVGITTAKITGGRTTTDDIASSTNVSTTTETIASSAAGSNTTGRSTVATTTPRIRSVSSRNESIASSKTVSSTTGSASGRSWTTIIIVSTASRGTVGNTVATITNASTIIGTIADSAAGTNTSASSTTESTTAKMRTVRTATESIASNTTGSSTTGSIPSTVNGSITTVRSAITISTTVGITTAKTTTTEGIASSKAVSTTTETVASSAAGSSTIARSIVVTTTARIRSAGSNTTASSTTGSTSGGKRTVSTTIESILNSTATSIPSTATVSNTIASSTTVGITTAKITDVSTTTEDIASSTTVSTTAGTIASSAAESNTTASNIVGTTTSRITSVSISNTTERTASSTSQSTSTRSVPNSTSPNSTIVINTTASSATLGITTAKITGVSTTTEDIPSSTTVSTATGTIASSAAGSNTTARSAVATATTSRIRGVSSTTESTVNSKAVSSTTGSVASAGGRSWTTVSNMSIASRGTVGTTATRITIANTIIGIIAERAARRDTTASSTAGSSTTTTTTVSTTTESIASNTTGSTSGSIPSTVAGSNTTVRSTFASSTTARITSVSTTTKNTANSTTSIQPPIIKTEQMTTTNKFPTNTTMSAEEANATLTSQSNEQFLTSTSNFKSCAPCVCLPLSTDYKTNANLLVTPVTPKVKFPQKRSVNAEPLRSHSYEDTGSETDVHTTTQTLPTTASNTQSLHEIYRTLDDSTREIFETLGESDYLKEHIKQLSHSYGDTGAETGVRTTTQRSRAAASKTRSLNEIYRSLDDSTRDIFETLGKSDYLKEHIKQLIWLKALQNEDSDLERFLKKDHFPNFHDTRDLFVFTNGEPKEIGSMKELLITECTMDRVQCDATWFHSTPNNKYGNCFTFSKRAGGPTDRNNKVSYISRNAGSRFGLRVTLNINSSEYVGLLGSDYGVRVAIHPPNTMAQPEELGFAIAPGSTTSVGIRRMDMNRLMAPYATNCSAQIPNIYKPYVHKATSYSSEQCIMGCKNYFLHKKCGCLSTNKIDPENIKTCDTFNMTERICEVAVQTMFHLPSTDKLALTCDCQPSCKEVVYTSSISTAKWPSVPYQQLKIMKDAAEDKVGSMFLQSLVDRSDREDINIKTGVAEYNLAHLHIYYETFAHKVVEETPQYPISQMWADLGGVAALYLGLSAISLFEVLQLFFFLCHSLYLSRGKINEDKDF